MENTPIATGALDQFTTEELAAEVLLRLITKQGKTLASIFAPASEKIDQLEGLVSAIGRELGRQSKNKN